MNASRARARARPTLRAVSSAGLLPGLLLVTGPGAAQTASDPAAAPSEPASASAAELGALTERVEGLERRLGASALLDLVTRIERVTNEIKEMRDRMEMQARSLDALQGRQQDLYAELDRLARRIVTPAPAGGPGASGGMEEARPAAPSRPGTPDVEGRNGVPDETVAAEEPRSPDSTGGSSGGAESAAESPSHYDPVEEQARYQRAFDLLSEGRFERAAAAFGAFLDAFPESRYRDDATFWQGECLYALREFEPALEKFRVLVETYAQSSRVPGAKLKIGFILHELGQSGEAAATLRDLVSTAPDSSEAKLARDRLARLE